MKTLIGSIILATYIFLSSPQIAFGDVVSLEWDKVTKDVSGNLLTKPLSGYKLYVAQTAGSYGTPTVVFIPPAASGAIESYHYSNTVRGTYFAVVTAYNSDGESDYSNEVTFTVTAKMPAKSIALVVKKVE